MEQDELYTHLVFRCSGHFGSPNIRTQAVLATIIGAIIARTEQITLLNLNILFFIISVYLLSY
jgi:hypothetical protein